MRASAREETEDWVTAALAFGSSEGDCRALAAAEQKTRTNKTAILFITLLLVSHVFQEIEEPPQRLKMRRGGMSRLGLVSLYRTSSGESLFDLENLGMIYLSGGCMHWEREFQGEGWTIQSGVIRSQ
jgi:hypothetical protein